MVVVKILPANSNSFNGISYNEDKLSKEKGALLEASNFIGLDASASKQDYIQYLQIHSKKNNRIKKPQIHLSISAKGKEKSFEELHAFAKHYVAQMGYKENPYVIYSHNDTDNNHIHFVSSRVDGDGKKISDRFERLKSQRIINSYYKIEYDLKNKVSKLNKYKISTVAQYKLLLENNFSKVKETPENFTVFQSDKKLEINKSLLNAKIEVYKKATNHLKKRKLEIKRQIESITSKTSLDQINSFVNKNDFEVKTFTKKGTNEIFGYTVIDHKSNAVFKGSEIISLKELQKQQQYKQNRDSILSLIQMFDSPKATLEALNEKLLLHKKHIDKNGLVYDKLPIKKLHDKAVQEYQLKALFRLKKSDIYQFNYNSKVQDINMNYKPKNMKEKSLLSGLFKVKTEDILISENLGFEQSKLNTFYNHSLEAILKRENRRELLESSKILLIKKGESFYVTDDISKTISLIELDQNNKEKILNEGLFIEFEDFNSSKIEGNYNKSYNEFLEDLTSLFHYEDEDKKTKGRKKQRVLKR